MASFEKVAGRIVTPLDMARKFKQFALASGLFTDAGNISGEQVYSLRHTDGWFFNFNFSNEAIDLTMTKVKPNGAITAGMPSHNDAQYRNTAYNLARTWKITYPLVSCHLIHTGKFIALVQEVANGIYRHTLVGKFDTYGMIDGGEFIGGTAAASNVYYGRGTNAPVQFGDGLNNQQYNIVCPFSSGVSTPTLDNRMTSATWIRHDNVFIPCSANNWGTSKSNQEPNVSMQHGFTQPPYYWAFGANTFNGRVPQYPIEWMVHFPMSELGKPAIPMFYTNEISLLNVTNIQAGEIVNEDWICFPITNKNPDVAYEYNTLGYGVAYKFK
nr:MAG TPA: hypothetical protein [Caudoviricetes sp.]